MPNITAHPSRFALPRRAASCLAGMAVLTAVSTGLIAAPRALAEDSGRAARVSVPPLTRHSSLISKEFFAEQTRKLFAESSFEIRGTGGQPYGQDPQTYGGVKIRFKNAADWSPGRTVRPASIAAGIGTIYRYLFHIEADSATASWSGNGVDVDVVLSNRIAKYQRSEPAWLNANGTYGLVPNGWYEKKDFPYSADHDFFHLLVHVVPRPIGTGKLAFDVTSVSFQPQSQPCVGDPGLCGVDAALSTGLAAEVTKTVNVMLHDQATLELAAKAYDQQYSVIPAPAAGKFDALTFPGANIAFWYD